MIQFVSTFQEKYVDWLKAIVEHLQLTLLSLIISVIIAIPIGILISKRKGISHICLQATGVLQTIPSLALLGLFIPFMGIGILPAMSALIIYALFPILQATITGIHMIDPILEEASTAFGMNRWEKLKKFELPLALPVIMDGVRTAGVMIIGTATLAALVGAGGLGSFILLGIDRNNGSLIMIGAISSAILAILFNFLLKLLERLKLKMILISFLVLIVGLGSSFMPNLLSSQSNRTLTIAGKMGPEPEILINMYKLLIEDNSDISVKIKPNFGKTDFLYEALKSGDIDIYPEFTGTITSTLLKEPPKLSNDSEVVFKAARNNIYKQDKLTLLKPMAYQNTFAIAVKSEFAKANGSSTISDLKKIDKKIKAGFTIEFNDREDGNRGLKNLYGLNLSVVTMEPSLRYKAIDKNDIQLMEVYSTDPEIVKYDLKVLKDDKQLFPPYQGAPLLRSGLLKEYPEIQNILNKLGNKISDTEMSEMNYEVGIEGKSAYKVAKTYLEKNGLLNS